MPASNAEIAELFTRLAVLLEIDGANPFRTRAYHNAAQLIREDPRALSDRLAAGEEPSDLEGIGKDLAAKIREIVETGGLAALREIEARLGAELVDLVRIPGLGTKRVRRLREELGVVSPAQLAEAAREGRLAALAGFGPRSEAAILEALERVGRRQRGEGS